MSRAASNGLAVVALLVAPGIAQAAADSTGKGIFDSHCAVCHQRDGRGIPGAFPPLKNNAALKETDFVVSVLLHGLSAPIAVNGKPYHSRMPAFADQLSAKQIADVLTYVRTAFNSYAGVSENAVSKAMSSGKRPENMIPQANQASAPSAEPSTASHGGAPQSDSGQPYARKTMDFTALQKALGKIAGQAPSF